MSWNEVSGTGWRFAYRCGVAVGCSAASCHFVTQVAEAATWATPRDDLEFAVKCFAEVKRELGI